MNYEEEEESYPESYHEENEHQNNGRIRGLWWMYPHSNEDNFVSWVMGCAWIWVIVTVFAIDWIDTTYYDGYGSVPLVMSLVLLLLLIITCGRGPCYWIHRDMPWAVMVGSIILVGMLLIRLKRIN